MQSEFLDSDGIPSTLCPTFIQQQAGRPGFAVKGSVWPLPSLTLFSLPLLSLSTSLPLSPNKLYSILHLSAYTWYLGGGEEPQYGQHTMPHSTKRIFVL